MLASDLREIDIADFIPSQRQLLTKTKLHQYVPPHILGNLTPETLPTLRGYLYPITVDEVMKWHLDCDVFWFWLTVENEQITKLYKMKSAAVEVIGNILSGDVLDTKLAGTQLKAAQLLLGLRDKPNNSVTQNTVNVSSGEALPKSLRKKSTVELQEELKRIESKNNPD